MKDTKGFLHRADNNEYDGSVIRISVNVDSTDDDAVDKLYNDLKSGKTVVWDRWRVIDEAMGGTFLEKTKNHFTISPRLGVAFPITERAKFYFNYGGPKDYPTTLYDFDYNTVIGSYNIINMGRQSTSNADEMYKTTIVGVENADSLIYKR